MLFFSSSSSRFCNKSNQTKRLQINWFSYLNWETIIVPTHTKCPAIHFSHLATQEIEESKNSFCNYPSASSYSFSSLRLLFNDIYTKQRQSKKERKSVFVFLFFLSSSSLFQLTKIKTIKIVFTLYNAMHKKAFI